MTAPATPLPCPFCGAAMIWGGGESAWLHPERVIRCAAQATALRTATQLAAWNRRVPPPGQAALVEALREALAYIEKIATADGAFAAQQVGDLLGRAGRLADRARAALSAVADDGADAAGVG